MPYQLFHDLFPEMAERETRMITVPEDAGLGVPSGNYSFLEMFCNDTGCDCRRVFFYVVSSLRKDVEAVIAWGWETRDYYENWLHDPDPKLVDELKGPTLNIGSPQTALAGDLLDLSQQVLLSDQAYVERVKRHYRMFRDKIDEMPERPRPSRARRKRKRKA